MHRPVRVPVLLAVGVLSISTAAVLIRRCGEVPPAVIAAARMGLAALALWPWALATRGLRPIRLPPGTAAPVVLAGFFLGAHFFFWITSLQHTSVVSSVVIVTTNPVFVGLASFLLLGERVGRHLVYGFILAAAGGALVMLADRGASPGSLYGDLMALLGAVMASCYLLVGRRLRPRVDLVAYVLPVYSIAALVLVAIALAQGQSFRGYSADVYVCFVLLALVPQLLGHSALNWALGHVSATVVAVCILGEPIGASLFAYFLLGEGVTPLQLAGSILILLGIFISARARTPATPPDATAM